MSWFERICWILIVVTIGVCFHIQTARINELQEHQVKMLKTQIILTDATILLIDVVAKPSPTPAEDRIY